MSDAPSPPPHLTPEEFRALGHRMVDFVADYWRRLESFPVRAQVAPGETAAKLPLHAPQQGLGGPEGWEAVFRDLEQVVLPGLTHWQSPSFFAYFPANASGPAVLGELLAAGLGVQGMLWSTSPAATELETRVLDWLAELLGLPASFRSTAPTGGGVIQGTASEAALVAMVAARRRVAVRGGGMKGPLVAYASTQAHSSILKAALLCGVAQDAQDPVHVRQVATDAGHALDPEALEREIRSDQAAGRVPFFVCATLGTTSSGAFDPLLQVAQVLERTGVAARGAWLHVDAAWAGAALVCPEQRGWLSGVERADSFAFNPHKWLLTNFDCDAFFTRDRQALLDALSVTPEYLRNAASASGQVIDYRDWQVPLGRRFRALKLWFVLRHYGVEGLQAHICEHLRLGELFESLVRADARFELAAPRALSLVCFRLAPRDGESAAECDARNRHLLEQLNAGGRAFLTHTVLPGTPPRYVLRMAIGATTTQERHVRAAWDELQRLA
ncbi:aspartate aminotransferase family protein [Aggregicoccus sp. 17bor-14]|uniref:pyridoxal-dependent decarboxylase n=1 Tax=Myxococcaceae TaxID=31 RepID=UPI00129C8AF7|nr:MULTISPECIES: pyridoxal-dependent decarboxylase [Myxococcaceae]MBF5046202.1 aspartate aminotransferase family protein [Simulacricoccus sp. 17bor-14]MRI91926.1 aspartate aminotransferase family protein [Aggregicoccus sp. 17bor-14]